MLLGLMLILPRALYADKSVSDIEASEYQVKAAYLYNFMKFVEWPDHIFSDEYSPIVLGILGDDPFGTDIDAMFAGKSVKNRPVLIKRLGIEDSLKACHVLFISDSEKDNLEDIFHSKLKQAPVLSVSDISGFSQAGGIINLIYEDNHIVFTINIKALKSASISMSSRLLKLAKIVNE